MSSFRATVEVRIKPSILDPQGRALERTLHGLGHGNVRALRVGKLIEFVLEGSRAEAEAQVAEIVAGILSNPVMEDASYSLREA